MEQNSNFPHYSLRKKKKRKKHESLETEKQKLDFHIVIEAVSNKNVLTTI